MYNTLYKIYKKNIKIQKCTNKYKIVHTHTHTPARRTLHSRPPVCVCVCVYIFYLLVHFCVLCTYIYIYPKRRNAASPPPRLGWNQVPYEEICGFSRT